ncbi:hypothetical protein TcarDRAFT_2367 [Thermosinus carboxydivorans Nor1]|uniref:HipA-like kinase domain-containing protein n=1 Tax=Thermosinus carboxydivorans Nor1 TaxID=401526 RepID=A1HNR4_9FIRM|nr:HipA family kinase [Thermosinus carboxydivorans]EAX48417.1 hypothetical protein TcarDRAFT_2367 [Thermosinus carboxydivorans Nor1]
MLTAVEYIGKVGIGITSPRFFRADDGKVYVVKLQNNKLGVKVLVNELLAAKIGQFMNLPFPPSGGIIEIGESLLADGAESAEYGVLPGRHFASEYLVGAEYLGQHNLDKASNTSEMAGVLLFDHMFHNPDRAYNKKNLLLRHEEDRYIIYAIDNSHLFRSGKWTLRSLERLSTRKRVYFRFIYAWLLRECLTAQDFLPYLARVKNLTDERICGLVREIPYDWLPDENERQALAEYIKVRRDMAEEIWQRLRKHIPSSRGGRRWPPAAARASVAP